MVGIEGVGVGKSMDLGMCVIALLAARLFAWACLSYSGGERSERILTFGVQFSLGSRGSLEGGSERWTAETPGRS